MELLSYLAGPAGGLITCLWLFSKFLEFQKQTIDKFFVEMKEDRAILEKAVDKLDRRLERIEERLERACPK
jgi:hypothetical protein